MIPDPTNRLTLSTIAQNAAHGRWRTEAMRSHRVPRLICVAKGQGRITISGLTSGYTANNLIFIPPGTMYGFEVGPTVYGQMITIPEAMASEWPDVPVHVKVRDVVAQKDLALLIDGLERELASDQSGAVRAALYQLGLLSIFFDRQIAHQPDDASGPRTDTAAARLVAAYTGLIEKHFTEGFTVAEFAARLGVTSTHLTRSCNKTAGVSAHKLLQDRILFEARVRLRETRVPVAQVARDLGFGSAAYFTRSFQSQTGLTPTGFRNKGPLSASPA